MILEATIFKLSLSTRIKMKILIGQIDLKNKNSFCINEVRIDFELNTQEI